MNKTFLASATGLMAMAIILGALGAHALESVLTANQLEAFETGVRYQVWHCLAIIGVQLFPSDFLTHKSKLIVSRLFLLGILLFSFSIYFLSLKDVMGLGSFAAILGPITPLGGLMFISAWTWLTVAIIRR